MRTAETVIEQINHLIQKAKSVTGASFSNLTDAVEALIAGYGTGGGSTTCSHKNTHNSAYTIENEWDTDHEYDVICDDCGAIVSEVIEACTDSNHDYVCDVCGNHIHTVITSYTPLGNGRHTEIEYCENCQKEKSRGEYDCKAGTTTIVNNGNGTHTFETPCRYCGGVKSSETSNCADNNGDDKCDVCGGAVAPKAKYEVIIGTGINKSLEVNTKSEWSNDSGGNFMMGKHVTVAGVTLYSDRYIRSEGTTITIYSLGSKVNYFGEEQTVTGHKWSFVLDKNVFINYNTSTDTFWVLAQ